ncbi:MAG: polysaccharide pyruvyl transferase family protein [Kofleriaceae bacterium]
MTNEITLITRVRTNNKGNQALSAAWVNMLQQAFEGAAVRVMERRPMHLLQYTLEHFASARDPIRAFDEVTSKLARLAPGPSFVGPPPRPEIIIDEKITPVPPFARLRQRLNLRRWSALAGRYREAYQRRLAAAQRSRFVLVNPAGEFFPHDPKPALYHLLDAFVIHKLGRPTAIVNHTMDITDPTLRKLIPWIYRKLNLVGFRDDKSISAFQQMGGDTANVVVTPDLALTTNVTKRNPRRPNTIAVAIHTPEAEIIKRDGQWIDLIARLRACGFEVALISNELPSDRAFFDRVQARMPVRVEGAELGYQDYAALLASYDFLVSSRMHTNILAMCAGTPVIPVEGPSFKISGLFQALGFERPVIHPLSPGWADQVLEQALAMRDRRDAAAEETTRRIATTRARIIEQLVPRLQAAVNPTSSIEATVS